MRVIDYFDKAVQGAPDRPAFIDRYRTYTYTQMRDFSNAIAAALHFTKRFAACDANRRAKVWDKFVMPMMAGKTMGFVGWGHIAHCTARKAAALGVRLVALRRHVDKPPKPNEPALAATPAFGFATPTFETSTLRPSRPPNFSGGADLDLFLSRAA